MLFFILDIVCLTPPDKEELVEGFVPFPKLITELLPGDLP
jgi:hypothetical protein